MEKALVLRTCASDQTSYGGFIWPTEIGTIVTCQDWNEEAKCGNGLHGLLDGFGDYSLLSERIDAIWQIVEVDRDKCIELDGKVKFQSCKLVYSGTMAAAMTKMSDYQINLLIESGFALPGDYSQLASSGNSSQLAASGESSQLAASGDYSQLASSGYYSQLAASGNSSQLASSGYSSQLASSGEYAKLAASGEYAKLAASGNSSQLSSSGDYSQLASSGYYSQLAASGNSSQLASSGYYSQLASSGDYSKLASSGDYSQLAASGYYSIVISAGLNGIASAGENGCIALTWWDDTKKSYRIEVGYIGENGIKPNTPYRLNDEHKFEEVIY